MHGAIGRGYSYAVSVLNIAHRICTEQYHTLRHYRTSHSGPVEPYAASVPHIVQRIRREIAPHVLSVPNIAYRARREIAAHAPSVPNIA
eukprot:3941644-Rhodomonas_salina.5